MLAVRRQNITIDPTVFEEFCKYARENYIVLVKDYLKELDK
ncbi:hypothetical protein [Clostridium thailandense]